MSTPNPLTPDQTTLLRLSATGLSLTEIALSMEIPVEETRLLLQHALKTLGVTSKLEACMLVMQNDW